MMKTLQLDAKQKKVEYITQTRKVTGKHTRGRQISTNTDQIRLLEKTTSNMPMNVKNGKHSATKSWDQKGT